MENCEKSTYPISFKKGYNENIKNLLLHFTFSESSKLKTGLSFRQKVIIIVRCNDVEIKINRGWHTSSNYIF